MTAQTIASLAVDSLIANGIDTLYCVPGVQNDAFFDALYHRRDRLTPVHARHEQGSAYMALGAALATGQPQAVSVVPGPGFLNASAALATAHSLNAPVMALVGQIPSGTIGRATGQLHEIDGQFEILGKFTKHAEHVADGARAPAQLADAWRALRSGRPQPVGLEIPVDCWLKPTDYDRGTLAVPARATPVPKADQLDAAARAIRAARCPMIVVGGGAHAHAANVRALAHRLGAGVVAYRTGHGVMPASDALSLTNPAGHALWRDCDLVIGLGTRLATQTVAWGLDAAMTVVHIDIDASAFRSSDATTVAVHADLADALPALLDVLGEQPDRSAWCARIAAVKATTANAIADTLAPQLAWLDAIRQALPADGVLLDELTQIGFVSRFAFPVTAPRQFLSTGYQGTLGWGIAAAIGAAHARRDVPVVSITGDGGALFTITELATAVHHRIPVNIVVMNDNAYGNVKGIQRDHYGGRYIASDLTSPDFVALAESFGATGARAETPDALSDALATAVASPDVNVIEVPVGEFPSPWPYILMPKLRGTGA